MALPAHIHAVPVDYEAKNGFLFQSFLVEFELPQQNYFRCVDLLRWSLLFTRWWDEYGCSCYDVTQMWEIMSMAAPYSETGTCAPVMWLPKHRGALDSPLACKPEHT